MTAEAHVVSIAYPVDWLHGWKWSGDYTGIALVAAFANALNGALLARRPDHYKNFTVVGIFLMGLLMGLGGGATRDVLLAKIPGFLTNPALILVALIGGAIGYFTAYSKGQLFREGYFQLLTSFSLPLYAVTGAIAASKAGLPVAGVLAIGIIGPTAGRWYVDVSCDVPPKQFIRGEWFVTIALLTAVIWVICDGAGLPSLASTAVSVVIGYVVRVLALFYGWEEPLAKEPSGVYIHDDGRPQLGRKLKGKSQRELASLGLSVNDSGDSK